MYLSIIRWNAPIMAGFASIGHLRGEAGLRELLFESNVSAVGSVKQNLSGKSFLDFVMWLFPSLPLPHHAVGRSAVCVCGSSWSYLLTFKQRSGTVVECLTRDRRVAGSSLTGVTALWSLSKTHLS